MNNIKVRTRFDFKALKVANLYVMKVKRKQTVIFWVLGFACIAGAVYTIFTETGQSKYFTTILFSLLGLYAFYSLLTLNKKVDKSLVKFFSQNAPVTQYIAFDDENVSICLKGKDGLEKVSYNWAYVQEAHELKEFYLLFLNGGLPIIIKRSEESMIEGTFEELEELIKDKCSMKPYKVYTKDLYKDTGDPITYLENEEPLLEEVIEKLNEVVVEEATAQEVSNAEEVEVIEETQEEVKAIETEENKEEKENDAE